MSVRLLHGAEALRRAVGTTLGAGEWCAVSQERVDQFCAATGHEPTGSVPPLLTLSLLPTLTAGIYEVKGFDRAINYGADEVRFRVSPPAGSRLRATVSVREAVVRSDHVHVVYAAAIEVEGYASAACALTYISRYYL